MYEGRGRGGAAKTRLILLSGQPDTSSFALVLDIIRTIMRIFALCFACLICQSMVSVLDPFIVLTWFLLMGQILGSTEISV